MMSRVIRVATVLMTLAHTSVLGVSSVMFAKCEMTSSPSGVPLVCGSACLNNRSAGFPRSALRARCVGDKSSIRAQPRMNPPPIGFPKG